MRAVSSGEVRGLADSQYWITPKMAFAVMIRNCNAKNDKHSLF